MNFQPRLFGRADLVITEVGKMLRVLGKEIQTGTWQGMQAPPPMLELLECSFRIPMDWNIETMQSQVKPNLPWADEHFEERISGVPSNPGESWKNWPYYPKDEVDKIIRKDEQFSHTYQERIWPKKAHDAFGGLGNEMIMRGIRYEYGDLDDVVKLLCRDIHTRQAFLPIWFPEDTGASHGGRVPCTLGYLFVYRYGRLHCTYYIRSCDYFRHFRDDIYLAYRLALYIMERVHRETVEIHPDLGRDGIAPGFLNMHIGNLHCWANERGILPK